MPLVLSLDIGVSRLTRTNSHVLRMRSLRQSIFLASVCFVILLIACPNQTDTPKPTGTIRGQVYYKYLKSEEPGMPISNVRIALCKLSDDKGLPEGAVVADRNQGNLEPIGIIQAEPTVVTDSVGSFILDNVPVGTYLILFHLWPDRLGAKGTDWHDIVITKGHYDIIKNSITASGKADFWENGGIVIGLADWSRDEGIRITEGTVGSETYGFCFGIRDEKPCPIVTVEANSELDVLVLTHIAPEGGD